MCVINVLIGSGQGLSAPLSPIVATSEVTQPHTTGDKSYHSPLAGEIEIQVSSVHVNVHVNANDELLITLNTLIVM